MAARARQLTQEQFIARWSHKLPARVQQQSQPNAGSAVAYSQPALPAMKSVTPGRQEAPVQSSSSIPSPAKAQQSHSPGQTVTESGADELTRRADEFRRRAEEAEAKLLAGDDRSRTVEATLAEERARTQTQMARALALEEELNELKAARTAGVSLAGAAARGALSAAMNPQAAALSSPSQVVQPTLATNAAATDAAGTDATATDAAATKVQAGIRGRQARMAAAGRRDAGRGVAADAAFGIVAAPEGQSPQELFSTWVASRLADEDGAGRAASSDLFERWMEAQIGRAHAQIFRDSEDAAQHSSLPGSVGGGGGGGAPMGGGPPHSPGGGEGESGPRSPSSRATFDDGLMARYTARAVVRQHEVEVLGGEALASAIERADDAAKSRVVAEAEAEAEAEAAGRSPDAGGSTDPLEGPFVSALLRPLSTPFGGGGFGGGGGVSGDAPTQEQSEARRRAYLASLAEAPEQQRVAAVRKLLSDDLDGLAKALGDVLVSRHAGGGGS